MKVAIIGSRSLQPEDFTEYLPEDTTVIISGGARGVDSAARAYALRRHIPYIEFRPDYKMYGSFAPLMRNLEIIRAADLVLAFWDGQSRGTMHVISSCRKEKIPCRVFMPKR